MSLEEAIDCITDRDHAVGPRHRPASDHAQAGDAEVLILVVLARDQPRRPGAALSARSGHDRALDIRLEQMSVQDVGRALDDEATKSAGLSWIERQVGALREIVHRDAERLEFSLQSTGSLEERHRELVSTAQLAACQQELVLGASEIERRDQMQDARPHPRLTLGLR